MANVTLNEEHLRNIANAIRTKKGTVNKMTPRDMAGEISSIVINTGGGLNTNDATATSGDIRSGKTGYVKGVKVTGTVPDNGNWNGTITDLNGITVPNGIHRGSGKVGISQSEKSKLIPSNIKNGVNILGINGSYQGSGGIDTSDATAVSSDILTGKTAYANGSKITGTMPNKGVFNADLAMTGISYTLKEGYYTGGLVQLAPSESRKLVPENIKSGITLFGVTGSYTGGSSGGGGSQIKTGTTSNTSIYTGLSSIDKFIIYADKINSMGMVNVIYDSSRSQVTATLCGSYNNYIQQCRTEIKTDGYSVSGGTFQWTDNSAIGSYMERTTYNWIAIGK